MRSFFDVSVISKLYHLIKNEKIDVLHNHGFRPEIYGGIAGRIAKCKVILATILHNPAQDIPLSYGFIVGYLVNFFRRVFAFFCEDILVAISEDAKNGLKKLHFPSKKIKVVYSGINPDLLKKPNYHFNRENVLAKFGIQKDKFVIGTIAALRPYKNISILINAAKTIIKNCPDAKILIIGKGPLKNSLESQVKSLNLKNHVTFCDYVENITEVLKIFDTMVLSSSTEGVPAVLLEAMVFNIPIVATEVGGIPEIIENGASGILVPPQNPEKLAEAVIKIYKNPELAKKITKNANLRFMKYLTAHTTARRYEKIYKEFLKK
jgi:glycosyltransferase involved in cell wall biosynthesis